MNSSQTLLVRTLKGQACERVPFWFMRQAGRYLPEYRELRSKAKGFLDMCYTPEMATEVTLQPIRRFGMDAAIIFSDILVIPHALGMEVWFEEGKGPMLVPVRSKEAINGLYLDQMTDKLAPVYEALRMTRKALPAETALIGFAGAPWTLACYVIEGRSGSDFLQVKTQSETDPEFFAELMSVLTDAVILHIKEQIKAGAQVIQIFDSWAGLLSGPAYEQWVIRPAEKIISAVKKEFPDVPVIAFPRQSGTKFFAYIKETKADGLSIDGSVPLEWARDHLQSECVVQGNLDPVILAGDKNVLIDEAKKILLALGDKPFVFNLGHGILPHTPVENMQALCEFLKSYA